MKILALDLSLTCSGWATDDACGTIAPPKGEDRGVARLAWLRGAVLERARGADLVVVEGYAYGCRGRAVISLGELGGCIRLGLHDAGVPFVEIPPNCRALFATGRGNAGKPEVLAAAIRELGYAGCSFDECDALWLYTMARAYYAGPVAVNAKRQKALAAVDWPLRTVLAERAL